MEAATRPADCVMAGIIGAAGLRPTLAAVAQGRRVALANKECLVCAGEMFMEAVRRRRHGAGAGRFRALGGVSGDRRLGPGCHRTRRAHRFGRAFPHMEPGAARARHAAAGARASELVHGPQDHDRLGDADEQGPRTDRGLSPVSRGAGPARGGRASAIDHPCAGRLPGRLHAGATGEPGHAHADCRGLWRGRPAWPRPRSASISSNSAP